MQRKRIQRASNLLKNHTRDADADAEKVARWRRLYSVWPNETNNLLIKMHISPRFGAQPSQAELIRVELG